MNKERISNTHTPCVATIGFFDGVHRGHRFLIEQVQAEARKRGLRALAITFPEHPKQVLHPSAEGKHLLTPAEEKAEKLHAIDGLDYLFLPFTYELSQRTAREFMEQLRDTYQVKVLFIGHDHRFGKDRSEGLEQYVLYGKELGMEVMQAQALEEAGSTISSTVIRSLLSDGHMGQAAHKLGYTYTLTGEVIKGHQIGRTLGFPTANIQVAQEKFLPLGGVYAVYVWVKGERYRGMLDIGTRPTLEDGDGVTVEVHILDFADNIYGETITAELVQYLRPDVKFARMEQLMNQLWQDRKNILRILDDKRADISF